MASFLALVLVLSLVACTKSNKKEIVAISSAQVAELEAALSGGRQTQEQVVAPELRLAFREEAAALPTDVKFDLGTFKSQKELGVIEADVAGKGRFIVYLLNKEGKWYVFHTEPKEKLANLALVSGFKTLPRSGFDQLDCIEAGRDVPVLFVHGFNSSGMVWGEEDKQNSLLGNIQQTGGVRATVFDYYLVNTQWVDHPEIGPKLAAHISCLAEKSRKGGGPGRVIVVAHSMGGLATRFAANQIDQITGKLVADNIALVATIGTPNSGSLLGSIGSLLLSAACSPALALGVAFKLACDATVLESVKNQLSAIDAMRRFTVDGKIDLLPTMPKTVPVLAIAGNAVVTFNLFGLLLAVPNSDLVVDVASASAGGQKVSGIGGGVVLQCTGLVPIPGLSDAPCEHNNLVNNQQVHALIAQQIQDYLKTVTPTGELFTFNGLRVFLPQGWTLRSAGGNEASVYVGRPGKNCRIDDCNYVVFLHDSARADYFANRANCAAPRVRQKEMLVGGKKATYYTQHCVGAPLNFWDIPEADLLIDNHEGVSIEKMLQQITW